MCPLSPAAVRALRRRSNHKNFDALLEAFGTHGLARDFELVVAGRPLETAESAAVERLKVQERVRLVTTPSVLELVDLYRGASAFIFPSLYEGFGLPLLESMACGAPVCASAAGPMPEIAGNAAVYFDPRQPESIAAAVRELHEGSNRETFAQRGLEHAREFSWDRTARGTAAVYAEVLG